MVKNEMRPIHPGEILREDFLVPLGMSAHALAKALRVTPSRVNDIVHEKRGISADTALRLARYFGGDPQSWLNLQQTYDLKVTAKLALQKIIDEIEPRDPRDNGNSYALAA
jgi:addiction module HigA family antidote